jgi:hypothetical protein
MVFRPEGAAALREYLQGARVPADVYLLRKMHVEDPNAGPVTRADPDSNQAPKSPPVQTPLTNRIEVIGPYPAISKERPIQRDPDAPASPRPPVPEERPEPRDGKNGRSVPKSRNGVGGFLAFAEPLPPSARSVEDVPALYAWMLEKDPVIPNNLARLQEIHAEVFRNTPAARLGYEQHLLLQVAEDLWVYTTEDALGFHLAQLAVAYRRAAEAYRKVEAEGSAANHPLWQMASLATRMRLEAWVYHARHGESPQLPSTRQRELPLKFPGH